VFHVAPALSRDPCSAALVEDRFLGDACWRIGMIDRAIVVVGNCLSAPPGNAGARSSAAESGATIALERAVEAEIRAVCGHMAMRAVATRWPHTFTRLFHRHTLISTHRPCLPDASPDTGAAFSIAEARVRCMFGRSLPLEQPPRWRAPLGGLGDRGKWDFVQS